MTPFQDRVDDWMNACFGSTIASDKLERSHRFLEESLELIQSCGCPVSDAHQLVDYVFGRPIGHKAQEVGGVFLTLAALCSAQGLALHACGDQELDRAWLNIEVIRKKQATKPQHSVLP